MKTEITERYGIRVMYFYDRSIRNWTAYAIDGDENQIGDARYCANSTLLELTIQDAAIAVEKQ